MPRLISIKNIPIHEQLSSQPLFSISLNHVPCLQIFLKRNLKEFQNKYGKYGDKKNIMIQQLYIWSKFTIKKVEKALMLPNLSLRCVSIIYLFIILMRSSQGMILVAFKIYKTPEEEIK